MRIFISSILVISLTSILSICYTKLIIEDSLGPVSIALLIFLSIATIISFISLLLYKTNKVELVKNIWLLILSTALIYLIIDVTCGYFLIPHLSQLILEDDYVHHKLAPNTNSHHRTRESNYIQRVNSMGLRGPEILDKEPGTYRILMLGDSFTMGKGVSDDKTFSTLLQKSLNRKVASLNRSKYEVLNAGVISYAPILSFLQLKKIGAALEPDMVVLNLDMGDLIQETSYRNAARYGDNGEIICISSINPVKNIVKEGTIADVRRWADKNLYFTRLILYYIDKATTNTTELTIKNTVITPNPELLKHTLADDTTDRTEQWRKIFESILNIKNYCDERDIDFLLTIYPWGHQVNNKEWVPGRRNFMRDDAVISDRSIRNIEKFSKDNSIALLNTFSAFRAYNGDRHLYFKYDLHWTPAGHEVMAQELDKFLSAKFHRASQELNADE